MVEAGELASEVTRQVSADGLLRSLTEGLSSS